MSEPIDGHVCDASATFVVYDEDRPVGIPIVDDGLALYERKEGPTAVTRRAEVTIPIEYDGETWTDEITAFDRGGDVQQAEVRLAPIDDTGERVGEPQPVFRGYVGQVGSSAGANTARLTVLDPATFCSTIEAGVTLNQATVRDALEYVSLRLAEEVPLLGPIDVAVRGTRRPTIVTLRDLLDRVPSLEDEFVERLVENQSDEVVINPVLPGEGFSSNRDTLADVLTWIQETYGVDVSFAPPEGGRGVTLVATRDAYAEYDITPSSDDLPYVIANDALYEMRPFNALTLRGKAGLRLNPYAGDDSGYELIEGFDGKYPEVTVEYEPLVERLGSRLAKTEESKQNTVATLREEARTRLKQKLDEVSGGAITTTLAPQVRPFDRLRATPACSGVAANVDALTYEVQRTIHKITPNDDNLPRTEVSVSIAVDPDEINVVEATQKATRRSSEGDNTPPENGGGASSYVWFDV